MTEQEKAQHEALVKENQELKLANEALVGEKKALLEEKDNLSIANNDFAEEVEGLKEANGKLEHTIKSLSGKLKKHGKGVPDANPIVRH